jgi:hypothetical protein
MNLQINNNNRINLIRDVVIIIFSIIIAIFIARTGIISNLLSVSKEWQIIGTILAGMFFISVFTVTPSAVVLAELSKSTSPLLVAIFGGIGALLGDLIIFIFIRDTLIEDLRGIVGHIKSKKFIQAFHFKPLKWLIPLLGAIIIASPLPDEIGIAMLGFSKMKKSVFIPMSFILNFLGILAIGLIVSKF